jgi:hypothetical protein
VKEKKKRGLAARDLEKGVTGKKNRGRQGAFWYCCRAAGGEEIRAPEEKELRGSGTWSFFLQQEVARVGNSGELQQQVSTVAGQRRLQSREQSSA